MVDASIADLQAQLAAANAIFSDREIELAPSQVATRLERGAIQLIDVREPHEYEAGRIPGARHLELERLAWNAPTLEGDRPIVFYCRLGVRAAMAAHAFRRCGFDAFTMVGGFQAWFDEQRPTEPPGAKVAPH